jgi:hypothetical protein
MTPDLRDSRPGPEESRSESFNACFGDRRSSVRIWLDRPDGGGRQANRFRHPDHAGRAEVRRVAVPIGAAWLQEAARDLTSLGSVIVLMTITIAVAGFLRFRALRVVAPGGRPAL